ncbi:type IV conjugative transfer system protein TraE [Geobacter sp. DSM 9736]|uniref:type IV conjugative transfer system protein TraE n=1 Tax=Geobacter sp. DSM 9736 TaxID=1277350 RepID=UPI000B508195|nr:type IV conjugative transfer system protein TraE [Geobacter sp. DSM 9736]SNB45423.1 conjugal transfer pilus assembly protein TraE [Geobacter sp. DSM 9736]
MQLQLFTSKAANTFAENRMLKFTVLVLLAAVIVLSLCVVTVMNKERVILVPPVINSKIMISGDKASEDYLREFTRYIISLALTYNPANARNQFSELLAVYDPAGFPNARKELYELADRVENTRASSAFHIQTMTCHPDKNLIEVEGSKMTYIGEMKADIIQTVYLVEYRFDNGRFILTRLYEKPTGNNTSTK